MTAKISSNRDLWRKVYQMYMIDDVPLGEIANRLGYNQDTSIIDVAHKFGMPSKKHSYLYNDLCRQMFTDEQEQILLGSLLGDGCIMQRTSRNCEYVETHSIHQLEYISWKQRKLYPFIKDVKVGHKGVDAQLKSVALPQLGFYRGAFYPKDKKIVPVESLQWLDDLALAVWYMDDGSISKQQGSVKFATCGFNLGNVGMLQGWLMMKYGVKSHIFMDKEYPNLHIMKEDTGKLLSVIEPHIVPSMRYKLGQ